MRLDFSNALVLTEPPMAIIAFVRECSLGDFVMNLRLSISPLMIHETECIEERMIKPLLETHAQIHHILKGVEVCQTAKEWEDLVRVIDPTLRLIYGVWSEVFRGDAVPASDQARRQQQKRSRRAIQVLRKLNNPGREHFD